MSEPLSNTQRLTGHSREGMVSRAEQLRQEALASAAASGQLAFDLDVALVDPNPYQPRVDFGAVHEMATNLRSQGQLYPILVRQEGDRYQVADGETRLRAIKLNHELHGLPATARAVLAVYDDTQMALVAFSSVYLRKDLNPIEEARGLRRLHDELAVSYETLAQYFGKSKSYFIERVRLLNLDDSLQAMVQTQELNPGQAIAISRLPQALDREQLARTAAHLRLPVSRVRELARQVPGALPGREPLTLETLAAKRPEKPVLSPREKNASVERFDELSGIWKYLDSSQQNLLLIQARRMVDKVEAQD